MLARGLNDSALGSIRRLEIGPLEGFSVFVVPDVEELSVPGARISIFPLDRGGTKMGAPPFEGSESAEGGP